MLLRQEKKLEFPRETTASNSGASKQIQIGAKMTTEEAVLSANGVI